jgi:hypothetical protein
MNKLTRTMNNNKNNEHRTTWNIWGVFHHIVSKYQLCSAMLEHDAERCTVEQKNETLQQASAYYTRNTSTADVSFQVKPVRREGRLSAVLVPSHGWYWPAVLRIISCFCISSKEPRTQNPLKLALTYKMQTLNSLNCTLSPRSGLHGLCSSLLGIRS